MFSMPDVHQGLQEKEKKLKTDWLVTFYEATQNERAGVFDEQHHLSI